LWADARDRGRAPAYQAGLILPTIRFCSKGFVVSHHAAAA
jgi:hypothetical protein